MKPGVGVQLLDVDPVEDDVRADEDEDADVWAGAMMVGHLCVQFVEQLLHAALRID